MVELRPIRGLPLFISYAEGWLEGVVRSTDVEIKTSKLKSPKVLMQQELFKMSFGNFPEGFPSKRTNPVRMLMAYT
jgi:hypothetical protein